jgi:hypothetical protein
MTTHHFIKITRSSITDTVLGLIVQSVANTRIVTRQSPDWQGIGIVDYGQGEGSLYIVPRAADVRDLQSDSRIELTLSELLDGDKLDAWLERKAQEEEEQRQAEQDADAAHADYCRVAYGPHPLYDEQSNVIDLYS